MYSLGIALDQHRPQRMAAKQVHVKMRNFLVCVGASIGQHAVPALDQAEVLRDLGDRAEKPGYQGV